MLNIFLYSSWIDRTNLHYASTNMNQIDLVEEMKQANITLPVFENQSKRLYAIQADNYTIFEEQVNELKGQVGVVEEGAYYTSFLSNPIELQGSVEAGFTSLDYDKIDSFLRSSQVLFGQEYKVGELDEANNVFVYYHVVNGVPIMDGTSQIIFYLDSNNNIFSYYQLYVGETIPQGSPLQTISDLDAVKAVYQHNEIPPSATVQKPVLAYHRTLFLDDLSMYVPVWVVDIVHPTRSKTIQIDATDGTIIQQSSQQDERSVPIQPILEEPLSSNE